MMKLNFRDQMDRWGWIVAVVALSLFFLRMFWGREAFCGAESGHCFREWVSALGGWVAIGVAIPTIYMLNKQIRDADRHQRTHFEISLKHTQALARKCKNYVEETSMIIDFMEQSWEIASNDIIQTEKFLSDLNVLVKKLENSTLQRFEDEIGIISEYTSTQLIRYAEANMSLPEIDLENINQANAQMAGRILNLSGMIEDLLNSFWIASKNHLQYVDRIVNE